MIHGVISYFIQKSTSNIAHIQGSKKAIFFTELHILILPLRVKKVKYGPRRPDTAQSCLVIWRAVLFACKEFSCAAAL